MGSNRGKTGGRKSRDTLPLNRRTGFCILHQRVIIFPNGVVTIYIIQVYWLAVTCFNIQAKFWFAPLSLSIQQSALRHFKIPQSQSRHRLSTRHANALGYRLNTQHANVLRNRLRTRHANALFYRRLGLNLVCITSDVPLLWGCVQLKKAQI